MTLPSDHPRPSSAPWAADVEELQKQTAQLASTLGRLARFAVDESDGTGALFGLFGSALEEIGARLDRLEKRDLPFWRRWFL